MATMELRRVPYGTTFTVFGDEFVALDYINGGVLAIRRDIWKDAPFDRNGVNDLRNATIDATLGDYGDMICEAGASENLMTMDVDLRATDGTREYGYYFDTSVSLLTLEQYGKYQHIIPDADRPWWLATPWRTPGEKCGGSTYTWRVGSNGGAHYNYCTNSYGVRPALLFNPSLLVSIEIEGEDDADIAEEREREMHERYCKYVRGWAVPDGGQELGSSPLAYRHLSYSSFVISPERSFAACSCQGSSRLCMEIYRFKSDLSTLRTTSPSILSIVSPFKSSRANSVCIRPRLWSMSGTFKASGATCKW